MCFPLQKTKGYQISSKPPLEVTTNQGDSTSGGINLPTKFCHTYTVFGKEREICFRATTQSDGNKDGVITVVYVPKEDQHKKRCF